MDSFPTGNGDLLATKQRMGLKLMGISKHQERGQRRKERSRGSSVSAEQPLRPFPWATAAS